MLGRHDLIDDGMQTMRLEEYGRMYGTSVEEAVQETAVITGTLPIHLVPVVVLFDSSSTLLTRAFVDRNGLTVGGLRQNLVLLVKQLKPS